MSQRIGEVVGNHLRLPACPGGKVEEGDVVVIVRMFRTDKLRCRIQSGMEIQEAFRDFGTDGNYRLDAWRFRQRVGDMFRDNRLSGADNHLDVRSICPIDNIFLRQQVSRGNYDGTQLMQRDDGEPELVPPLQNQHHHVAASDAERLEISCRPVGPLLHVGKREVDMFAVVISPAECPLVGLFRSPGIYYIVAEVEPLRHLYLQVLPEVVLRLESRLA